MTKPIAARASAVMIALALAVIAVRAQSPASDAHVAAAKAAAGTEFAGVFSRICTEAVPRTPPGEARGRAGGHSFVRC